jgi:PQQ-dependent catabolism-associated CXXCW motif protein
MGQLRALRLRLLIAGALLGGGPALALDAIPGVDANTGYRMGQYRAPTPPSVPGATTVDAKAVIEAQKAGAVLLDVMAAQGGGPDPQTGEWRIQTPREHIPGSVWLPGVGVGAPSPAAERYFRTQLEKLAGPPPGRPLVIYCQADCWMSWNASRRAASWGYTAVQWFPEGSDGWRDAGLPLAPAPHPPPFPVD